MKRLLIALCLLSLSALPVLAQQLPSLDQIMPAGEGSAVSRAASGAPRSGDEQPARIAKATTGRREVIHAISEAVRSGSTEILTPDRKRFSTATLVRPGKPPPTPPSRT